MQEYDRTCIKARLVAIKDSKPYERYVFQDLEANKPIVVTRCPNWSGKEPSLLQEGYLEYKYAEAGKDTYYDPNTSTFNAYQYTTIYFLDFIPITHVLKDGYVVESEQLKIS